MKVQVYYRNQEDTAPENFVKMCVVSADTNDVDDALEYAYRWTQNINGSWSRDDLDENFDRNENVTEIAPLREYNGKLYGHRSSMVRDRFIVEGEVYEVMGFGFRKVEFV